MQITKHNVWLILSKFQMFIKWIDNIFLKEKNVYLSPDMSLSGPLKV